MKRFLIILTISCLGNIFFNISAQKTENSKEDRIERLKSQKIAFLSEKLQLTPSVAQKFWPFYNEFSQKSDSLWHLQKSKSRELHDTKNNLTDHQKETLLDKQVMARWEMAKLEKEFHEGLKKILTINQVIKFYDAEHDYKKKLLQLLRQPKSTSNNQRKSSKDNCTDQAA